MQANAKLSRKRAPSRKMFRMAQSPMHMKAHQRYRLVAAKKAAPPPKSTGPPAFPGRAAFRGTFTLSASLGVFPAITMGVGGSGGSEKFLAQSTVAKVYNGCDQWKKAVHAWHKSDKQGGKLEIGTTFDAVILPCLSQCFCFPYTPVLVV